MGRKDQGSLTVGRRDLLRGAAVLAVPFAPALAGCSSTDDAPASERFKHGVASGDPLPDGVILWTRVTSDDGAPVDADWEVAEDPEMTKRVASGTAHTDAERDFTVKVDVRGLLPGRTYYYRFRALGGASRVGRTRTAPSGADAPACASRWSRARASRTATSTAIARSPTQLDLDAVVHLGDYIYEYGDGEYGDVRKYEPPTRDPHARGLPDAARALQARPGSPGGPPAAPLHHDLGRPRDRQRRLQGRRGEPHRRRGGLVRRAQGGRAPRLHGVDADPRADGRTASSASSRSAISSTSSCSTRASTGAPKQPGGSLGPPPAPDPDAHAPRRRPGRVDRGPAEDVDRALEARSASRSWSANLILEKGKQLANLDQWQGYPESRTRLLSFLRDSGVKDVVVLTGDIHSSWANELVDRSERPEAVRPGDGQGLARPSSSSRRGSPRRASRDRSSASSSRRGRSTRTSASIEPSHRGFVILDVTPERIQAAWHLFDDIALPEPVAPRFSAAWSVKAGETRLVAEQAPAPPRDGASPAAP